jgi:hypothetical protein
MSGGLRFAMGYGSRDVMQEAIRYAVAVGIVFILIWTAILAFLSLVRSEDSGAIRKSTHITLVIFGIGTVLWLVFILVSKLYGFTISVAGHPAFPFIFSGLVGSALLFVSVIQKNTILGTLGAGLVAAAFSHWVGPITFPK